MKFKKTKIPKSMVKKYVPGTRVSEDHYVLKKDGKLVKVK